MKLTKRKTILIVVVGMLIVLSLNLFQKSVKGFFYSISAPIQKTLWQAGDNVSCFVEGIFRAGELKKESEALKLTAQQLLAENSSLKELQQENKMLREALEIGLAKEFRLALADVIAKDIGQDSILINQGSADGLTEGMPIVTQEKVLLGRITEVYENFSRISLISHKESSFDVKIAGTTVAGIVKGRGGSKLFLDFVSQEEQVQEGDLVISSTLAGIFPKGLLVGFIKQVQQSDIQPFYEIEVSPFFDLKEIDNIFIILNP